MCYVPKNARNLRHWAAKLAHLFYVQVTVQLPFHCIYILFRSKLAVISNSLLKRSLKIVKISIIITEVIHIFLKWEKVEHSDLANIMRMRLKWKKHLIF